MKTLSKIITFIQFILFIFLLTSTTQINTFASPIINADNRKISNVAVLLYSFDDLYMLEIKQKLEDLQNETLDSLLNKNIDLFILNLADTSETPAENAINKIKITNVPVILTQVSPEVVSKVSRYYDKAVFVHSTSEQEGILEGKILVDEWNNNRKVIDKNGDNILQYVLLKGRANDPIAIGRTKDVISTINASGIKSEELALINATWFKEFAKESIENLFLKYSNKVEAIISNNDAMAIGAIEALQKYGYNTGDKSKYISVVGIDGIEKAKDLINKGLMTGTVIIDPKITAEAYYNIGMNLINNKNPIENTNNNFDDGSILIPLLPKEYTAKANIS